MVKKTDDSWHNHWKVGLCTTCFEEPLNWLLACVCPPCFSWHQRYELMDGDLSEYKCCAGAYCGDCHCFCGRNCPALCLCLETFCCFWCSVFGNRWMIQSQWGIENTALENCVLWCACICSWIRVIWRCIGPDCPGDILIEVACDLVYCALSACMQSQQEAEIHHQRGDGPAVVEMKD